MTANKITSYRRIENWENFFLDSALYSVGVSLGVTYPNEFTPITAVTGDLFAYLYSDKKPCDSGLTNYFFLPDVVKKTYALFGYTCDYLSNAAIHADMPAAMAKIRTSVDRGIPVLAWGMGGVVFRDGARFDPLVEGSLIGGYDGDHLLVQLYPGAERLAENSVDEDGYTTIAAADGLATTYGIFIVGERIAATPEEDFYRETLASIPKFLNLLPADGYVFGRSAFDAWAEVLLDDTNWQTEEQCDASCWDKHCSAYCAICTSIGVGDGAGRMLDYLARGAEVCPQMKIIGKIYPHYVRMRELSQAIWDTQDGFMPSSDKMIQRSFREQLAGILREMGVLCEKIVMEFGE